VSTVEGRQECVKPMCMMTALPGGIFCRDHAPIAEVREARENGGLEALERMDAGVPQQPSGASPKWTREAVIEAIRDKTAELGHPPASKTVAPVATAAKRIFGSWANAVEAAGFDRPTRGGRPGVKQPRVRATPAVAKAASLSPAPRDAEAAAAASEPVQAGRAVDVAPPPDGLDHFRLRLSGDFRRDATRVRHEAQVLRRQADALDQIAQGLAQLAEASA
jgi:hypothetical protein